ncbi:hypothetical protein CC78DRAFT_535353 [Lojkania enalia]|uniref:Centromere protein X n=1 Tax=Lojkania enalia TaxID=147567 RepID=A0A9P4MXV0_9PLEO|nr:hypothetical protein CC78DRAFT_535353 [Didymosphaeria enalia]
MPVATASNAPKRKGPIFKPPRPVKPAAQLTNASTDKRATGAVPRSAAVAKKAAPSRPTREPIATLISSSESESEVTNSEADRDEDMQNASDVDNSTLFQEPTRDPIPPRLLSRLLYEGFENSNTQIQKGAMDLVGHYMNIFVREAIARAEMERQDARKGGGISDGFLQVEDLEKLAPQLVLDF